MHDSTNVACLLLSAGSSRRMGTNKLSLPLETQTVFETTLGEIEDAPFAEVIVVTGHEAEVIKPLIARGRALHVHNPNYNAGMHSSIRAGLENLPASEGFVAVCLADQPLLKRSDYTRLIEAAKKNPEARLISPTFRGQRGNPVLISLGLKKEILAHPDDDKGCAYLFKSYPDRVVLIEMPTDACLIDVDTPEAYQRLLS